MPESTILFLTDNVIDHQLGEKVINVLKQNAGSVPILSVSQKPLDLGTNICVGDIGRSWMSIYKQLMIGIDAIQTKFVTIAEHDCLYPAEHLQFIPTDESVFWMNKNCWLVQWGGNHPELNGMYSYWSGREAMSMTICEKELYRKCAGEVYDHLLAGYLNGKRGPRHGQPDPKEIAQTKAYNCAMSGRPVMMQMYLKDYCTRYPLKKFRTQIPMLDVRHSDNFTGPKRGKLRRYELPGWGKFKEFMANA